MRRSSSGPASSACRAARALRRGWVRGHRPRAAPSRHAAGLVAGALAHLPAHLPRARLRAAGGARQRPSGGALDPDAAAQHRAAARTAPGLAYAAAMEQAAASPGDGSSRARPSGCFPRRASPGRCCWTRMRGAVMADDALRRLAQGHRRARAKPHRRPPRARGRRGRACAPAPWLRAAVRPAAVDAGSSRCRISAARRTTGPSVVDHRQRRARPAHYGLVAPGRRLQGGRARACAASGIPTAPTGRCSQRSPSGWSSTCAQRFPGLDPEPVHSEACLYTLTPDDDFILDAIDGVIVCGGDSGHAFKFGPLLGRLSPTCAQGRALPAEAQRFRVGEAVARAMTELIDHDAWEIAAAVRTGEASAVEIAEQSLARLEADTLGAVWMVTEERALREAAAVDAAARRGRATRVAGRSPGGVEGPDRHRRYPHDLRQRHLPRPRPRPRRRRGRAPRRRRCGDAWPSSPRTSSPGAPPPRIRTSARAETRTTPPACRAAPAAARRRRCRWAWCRWRPAPTPAARSAARRRAVASSGSSRRSAGSAWPGIHPLCHDPRPLRPDGAIGARLRAPARGAGRAFRAATRARRRCRSSATATRSATASAA